MRQINISTPGQRTPCPFWNLSEADKIVILEQKLKCAQECIRSRDEVIAHHERVMAEFSEILDSVEVLQ